MHGKISMYLFLYCRSAYHALRWIKSAEGKRWQCESESASWSPQTSLAVCCQPGAEQELEAPKPQPSNRPAFYTHAVSFSVACADVRATTQPASTVIWSRSGLWQKRPHISTVSHLGYRVRCTSRQNIQTYTLQTHSQHLYLLTV